MGLLEKRESKRWSALSAGERELYLVIQLDTRIHENVSGCKGFLPSLFAPASPMWGLSSQRPNSSPRLKPWAIVVATLPGRPRNVETPDRGLPPAPLMLLALLLGKAVQVFHCPQEDLVTGRDGTGQRVLVQLVDRQDFEFLARLEHRCRAIFAGRINLAVRQQR